MCQKGKDLATIGQNHSKSHLIEIDTVRPFAAIGWRKMRGEKMKGCSTMLLKTNGENMSEIGLSTMLMKTNDL